MWGGLGLLVEIKSSSALSGMDNAASELSGGFADARELLGLKSVPDLVPLSTGVIRYAPDNESIIDQCDYARKVRRGVSAYALEVKEHVLANFISHCYLQILLVGCEACHPKMPGWSRRAV